MAGLQHLLVSDNSENINISGSFFGANLSNINTGDEVITVGYQNSRIVVPYQDGTGDGGETDATPYIQSALDLAATVNGKVRITVRNNAATTYQISTLWLDKTDTYDIESHPSVILKRRNNVNFLAIAARDRTGTINNPLYKQLKYLRLKIKGDGNFLNQTEIDWSFVAIEQYNTYFDYGSSANLYDSFTGARRLNSSGNPIPNLSHGYIEIDSELYNVGFNPYGVAGNRITAVATVVGGVITAITRTNNFVFTNPPTGVVITDSTGTGARATVALDGSGKLVFTVTNGGSGYSSTPSIYTPRPGGTGQGAVLINDVNYVKLTKIIATYCDAATAITRYDALEVLRREVYNHNFDADLWALGKKTVGGNANLYASGFGTHGNFSNNDNFVLSNQIFEYPTMKVTSLINSSSFICDSAMPIDMFSNKNLIFLTGANERMSTNQRFTISSYDPSTQKIILSTNASQSINIGDQFIIGTNGLIITSNSSGQPAISRNMVLRNFKATNTPGQDLGGAVYISSNADNIEIRNFNYQYSFDDSLLPGGTATNIKVFDSNFSYSGLNGINAYTVGIIAENNITNNNGLRSQTGNKNGLVVQGVTGYIRNHFATDTKASGLKLQDYGIRTYSPATTVFINGGNVEGNNSPISLNGTQNSVINLKGVNPNNSVIDTPTSNVYTVSIALGNTHFINPTANCTISFRPAYWANDRLTLIITNDSTGRTITWNTTPNTNPPVVVPIWKGTAPNASVANLVTVVEFVSVFTGGVYTWQELYRA
jgi:hypothetical protein